MRLIRKIKAALGGLCSLACQRVRTLAGQWLPLLLVLAIAEITGVAFAATEPETTLTNTVNIAYTVGSGASIQNQTSVSLVTSKRTPARIAFYSVFEGGSQTPISATQFSAGNSSGASWQPVDSSVQGTTSIIETFSFSAGEPLIIRVEDFDQNLNGSIQETITIDLEINNTGDTETLLLTETEPGSGVFIGVIPMVSASATPYDGQLSVESLSRIAAVYTDAQDQTDTVATLGIVEPSNVVFDSTTGEPINGAVITLVNNSSGEGARVYTGDDGSWPSTVISGSPVTLSESARNVAMGDGEFRYPRVFGGEYLLKVVPPVGYRFPSQQSQSEIARLGEVADQVETGSRGEVFSILHELGAVLLNIPLDPFDGRFSVTKEVDQDIASIGDDIKYTVTVQNNDPLYELNNVYLQDTLPPGFRYIEGSAMFSTGAQIPSKNITVDGRHLKIALGSLLADAKDSISYRAIIGAGSPSDEAVNSVQGFSDDANSNIAHASVEIRDELMYQKNILTGRVFSGKCDDTSQQSPVKNARLYLNNGRTVLTDSNGRWHMEGLEAGTHVIQLDEASLPNGVIASPCKHTAQHLGQRYARMLQLSKGGIWRADFHVDLDKNADASIAGTSKLIRKQSKQLAKNPLKQFDEVFASEAAPGFEFLWPPEGHVPAISTIKVAVKYPPKQRLKVLLNGKEISPINLEGSVSNKAKTVAISRWTGVDIKQKNNTLTAIVSDISGKELQRIERHVHFTEESIKATLVKEESVLVADGQNQPVIAIRLEDKEGFTPRPRTHGFYSLEHTRWKVVETESTDSSERVELNKSQDGRYEYQVSDDGLMRVRLEPTAQSGMVTINVHLTNGETGTVRAWLQPALRDWIMVGYAKGTVGHKTLSGNLQTLADLGEDEGRYREGRISFFAKGRIKGKYLLTLAYDSAKQSGEVGEQLDGTIDPDAWYTLYGDDQTQQYEAPSSSKLYVKLEKDQFYALFGDYHTDLDTTELGRYQRTLHGLKSSYEGKNFQYSAFVSETSNEYQRDDIRGDGTSGLYYLTREAISNSETVSIETRDRDNPEVVLESRSVSRYVDYDIDYENSNLFFKFPISGSDDDLNPIYIVVEYESEDDGGEKDYVAGGRVGYTSDSKGLNIGISYLREGEDAQLVAVDAEYKVNEQVKLKAEAAHSDVDVKASAWLAEAEYHKGKIQGRLYANQQDEGFGLGQQSGVSEGDRKFGVTADYKLSDDETFLLEASKTLSLETDDTLVKASAEWQKNVDKNKFTIGLSHTDETVGNESEQNQTVKVAAGRALADGRLAVNASLEKRLGSSDIDSDSSRDRLKLIADYKLTEKVSLFAEQEYSRNDFAKGSQARVGLKSTVWKGGTLRTDLVREADDADTTLSKDYFLLGLSQHWKVNENLYFDVSFDRAKTVDLVYASALEGDLLSDDYYAISIGAGWNSQDWSAAGRVEYRESETEERSSLQYKAVRKKSNHFAMSQELRVVDTQDTDGDSDREAKFGLGFALRSKDLEYTLLNQLDFIDDKTVTDGEVERTRKVINNLHLNRDIGKKVELSLHHGVKFTQSESDTSHWGVTDTLQAGLRYDINGRWDAGVQGGILQHHDTGTSAHYAGISLGFTPAKNTRVELGYNVAGFSDEDFSSSEYTSEGPYINLNYMLDQSLLKRLNR